MWPAPEIPEWARSKGCPPPLNGESFKTYVERLGLCFEELVADLDPRLPDMANLRLASALQRGAPLCFYSWHGV